MDREQIMDTIRTLAKSQGFYSRLLAIIESNTDEQRDSFLNILEAQNFRDTIDLINYLEG